MKLVQNTVQTFQGLDAIKQLRTAYALAVLCTSFFVVGVVPFIRRDFGERYLSWPNLFFGYSIVGNFTFLGSMFAMGSGGSFSVLMLLFFIAFLASSIYHRWEISRKLAAGQVWHTMFPGESILPVSCSAETIQKWIEPGLVFILGLALYQFATVVGVWLLISAFSLLLHNHLVHYYEREKILDGRDAQIEAKNMQAALAGRPAKQTSGFVFAESSRQLLNQDSGLKAAFMSLSSELKAIIDPAESLVQVRNMKDALTQAGMTS